MKQRSPVTSLLLALFVPFYYLYWLYVTGKTIDNMGGKAPSIMLLVGPFLLLLSAVIVSIIGGNTTVTNIFGIIAGIVGMVGIFVLPIIYEYKFSKEMEKISNGQISTGVAFVLMFFIAPAAVYLFQDKLNDIANNPSPVTANTVGQPLQQPSGSPAFASNQPANQQQPFTAPQQQQPAQQYQPQQPPQAQPAQPNTNQSPEQTNQPQ